MPEVYYSCTTFVVNLSFDVMPRICRRQWVRKLSMQPYSRGFVLVSLTSKFLARHLSISMTSDSVLVNVMTRHVKLSVNSNTKSSMLIDGDAETSLQVLFFLCNRHPEILLK